MGEQVGKLHPQAGSRTGTTAPSYRDAGVDLDAAERAKARLKDLVASTRDENTLSDLGSFGGLLPGPSRCSCPGAGGERRRCRHQAQGRVPFRQARHGGSRSGEPLRERHSGAGRAPAFFFLDYLAVGAMNENVVTRGRSGGRARVPRERLRAARGRDCSDARLLCRGRIRPGRLRRGRGGARSGARRQRGAGGRRPGWDRFHGAHTNGYTLARRIVFDQLRLGPDDPFPTTGRSVADELLEAHRSYVRPLLPLVEGELVHALAHITGGGIPGNLPRVLGPGLGAVVQRDSWELPPCSAPCSGRVRSPLEEMDRVFNMGVGMIAIVPPAQAMA